MKISELSRIIDDSYSDPNVIMKIMETKFDEAETMKIQRHISIGSIQEMLDICFEDFDSLFESVFGKENSYHLYDSLGFYEVIVYGLYNYCKRQMSEYKIASYSFREWLNCLAGEA